MNNDFYISTIIELVKTIKNKKNEDNVLIETNTLLNRMLRFYKPPLKSIFLSKSVIELYSLLCKDPINKTKLTRHFYANNITKSISINVYKNMLQKPQKISINKNQKCNSKDFFIGDHIVPIGIIKKNLINLEKLNRVKVQKELDKIRVAFITTEEDRNITKLNKSYKSNRVDDYKKVINTIYKDAGIEISYKIIKGY